MNNTTYVTLPRKLNKNKPISTATSSQVRRLKFDNGNSLTCMYIPNSFRQSFLNNTLTSKSNKLIIPLKKTNKIKK